MSTITFIPVIPKTQLQSLAKNRGYKLSKLINEALEVYIANQSTNQLTKQISKTKKNQIQFNQLLKNISIPSELNSDNIDDILAQDICK